MPKVWGGDRLARFGKHVRAGDRVGESWEVADLDETSASGAGGGAARSVIENGPLAGKTLREVMGKPFPLLVKFLDAQENLSVQVHPSIAYAKSHPGAHIKTECWYILEARPGSVIYKGVREGVTREVFERHLRDGDWSRVVQDLEAVPAVAGEMHNLPSGTVHALGAGVVVAEVQTPSDTTFRVYDWGRQGRALHIDEAMECITFGPARDATRGGVGMTRLVSTGYYLVDELCADGAGEIKMEGDHRAMVLMCVRGACVVRGAWGDVAMSVGQTAVVPGGAGEGEVWFEGTGVVLRAVVMGE